MARPLPFGARSTADKVLAGIDLTGKRIVVTGCNSGIGFETMSALGANGAHVVGLARSLQDAKAACAKAGPSCTPVGCDLAEPESVAASVDAIRALQGPLDAVIANAGIANVPTLQTRNGVEMQFLVNHIGHFALVNGLLSLVRDGTGRIVIVSSRASINQAPPAGILFDNLDGRQFYDPGIFYGQSKLANALFAKELSRRLSGRGIAVNSLDPGATRGTGLHKNRSLASRIALAAAKVFMKSAQQGAATQALLAASPSVAGITGEFWSDCRIARGNPLLDDAELGGRLWHVSEEIVDRQSASVAKVLRAAA
ncbi:MAG TPA: SDR family NAD(P)-dependent oxidoreductase [Steroidobacteraceae bacterium]|nr:SDR family NAD(P)-dependent oxidoreductase [Steroidobacteraceae bacterium]